MNTCTITNDTAFRSMKAMPHKTTGLLISNYAVSLQDDEFTLIRNASYWVLLPHYNKKFIITIPDSDTALLSELIQ